MKSNLMRNPCKIVLFVVFCSYLSVVHAAKKPNIIVMMVDDLGYSDFGCYGSEIKTPNIDELAENGLRLRQFYNTAKCQTTRVSLMSGLYSKQAGYQSLSNGATIAELVRKGGYFTAMTGKWHLNSQPTKKGFDRYFGHLSGATNFFIGDDTFRLNGEPWSDFDKDFYTTDANTDYAIRFMGEAIEEKKPFFMYIAHNAPHYPLQAKEEDVKKYKGHYDKGWDVLRQKRYQKQLKIGAVKKSTKLSQRMDHVRSWDSMKKNIQAWESERMEVYAAMVDRVDQNVGKLVRFLKKTKQYDNTLIMIFSDNGACPYERTKGKDLRPWDPKSYWTYDVGWAHLGNTPFKLYKRNQHEGGISSPFIAHWPKGLKTKAGSWSDEPSHVIDIMATCIDIAGVKYPEKLKSKTLAPLQGKSLLPVFQNKKIKRHDSLFFVYGTDRAIRQGPFKLVSFHNSAWELYNMDEDRSETMNLASQYPKKVKELEKLYKTEGQKFGYGGFEGVGEQPANPTIGLWNKKMKGKGKKKNKKVVSKKK